MNVLALMATLGLDKSQFDNGLTEAQTASQTLGQKIGGGLKTAAKVGAAALGAATAAATGFAASAVSAGKDFDTSMSQVVATMGFSLEDLEDKESEAYGVFQKLRDFAQEQGATTAFSAKQAADALNYMALAGYDAETSISMLPNVLNLAAAGSLELATASDMVTDASSALGLSLPETEELIDKMAKAASKSNTSVGQLGDAILTVGGTAKNLAGGTTELATALGILADNGIKGAEGGTAIRNIILELSAPTDKAAEKMEELGLQVFDANGNMRPLSDTMRDLNGILGTMTQQDRTDVLNTIFNKVDLKSVNAMLGVSGNSLETIKKGIEDSGVEWSKYADKVYNAEDKIDSFASSMNYALNVVGDSAEEIQEFLQFEVGMDADDAMKVVASMTKAIDTQSDRWTELSGAIDDAKGSAKDMAEVQLDNLAGDITLFQSALEGAKIAISDELTPSLRKFTQFGSDALSKLTIAFQEGGLTGAMQTLGTVIADGISMITESLPQMVDAGAQLLGALVQGIVDNLPTMASAAIEIAGNLFTMLQENLPTMVQGGIEMLQGLGQGIQEHLPEFLQTALTALMEFSGTLRENVGYLVDAGLDLIMSLAQSLIDNLPIFIETVPTIISNIAGLINDNLPKIIATGISLLGALVSGIIDSIPVIWRELPKIVKAVADVITAFNWMNLGSKLINWLVDGVKALFTALPNIFKSIGQTAVNIVKGIDWIGLGKTIINTIKDGIWQLANRLPEILSSIGEKAMAAFRNVDWWGLGKAVIAGLASGITAGVSKIADAAKNAARSALDAAKRFLGIHSPSTVFRDQIGKQMAAGLGIGFEKNVPTDDMVGSVAAALDEIGELEGPTLTADMTAPVENGRALYGQTVINVYPSEGMDEQALAEKIDRVLTRKAKRDEAVYA